jgi:hypothetical protein
MFLGGGEKVLDYRVSPVGTRLSNRTVGRDYCFRFQTVLMHRYPEPLAQPYIPSARLDGHEDFFMGFPLPSSGDQDRLCLIVK